jgi:lipopolysaccharide transport system ATP-binding protein
MISVEKLGKRYSIRHQRRERYVTFREVLSSTLAAPFRQASQTGKHSATSKEDFWALKNVSFDLARGEVLGIIGRNGAGKSTLLKVLSRITEPTEGRVTLEGRVASLLEVGTGFHPELTGRENIFLNGAILGMARSEIIRKFDEIVTFAEVEQFLDTPVKRYSSGMYVRLAFAVAAHIEPEILIVDEVLAVGDVDFQKKCLGKMQEVSQGGRTVLFVSHNMAAIQALCSKAICLEKGTASGIGDVDHWIAHYLSTGHQTFTQRLAAPIRIGEALELQRYELLPNPLVSGACLTFRAAIFASQATKIGELALLIHSSLDARIAIVDLRSSGLPVTLAAGETWTISGSIKALRLVEGEYRFGMYVCSSDFAGDILDLIQLNVTSSASSGDYIPYPAVHRGLVELDFTAQFLRS